MDLCDYTGQGGKSYFLEKKKKKMHVVSRRQTKVPYTTSLLGKTTFISIYTHRKAWNLTMGTVARTASIRAGNQSE